MKRSPNLLAFFALAFPFLFALEASCQTDSTGIGIGTSLVDKHAALHIVSPTANQGVLLPNWTSISSGHIAEDERLLAYHSGKNRFVFFGQNGGLKWMYLNPWLTSDVRLDKAIFATIPGKIAVNTSLAPIESIEVNGVVSAYYDKDVARTSENTLEGNGILPVGGIIIWTGEDDGWPDNFVLCNGQTSHSRVTPNLVDRFVLGGKDNIGAKGGNHSKTKELIQYESGSSSQNRITSPENQPVFYQVAFIMRVY